MDGAIKTNEGVSVVYRAPDGKTFKKGFLLKQQPNWNPIGLEHKGLIIPFSVEMMSWQDARQLLGASLMPNATEVLAALTKEFREDFNHCAEVLGVSKLETARIPLAVYPEECNLHPMHRERNAPFFYPAQMSDGYADRAIVLKLRLARREE